MTDYADAILRRFHRSIDRASSLGEPTTTEPARARRIIALLVETLGGFAYGTAAGEVVRAVSTWFGPARAAEVRAAMSSTPRPTPVLSLDDQPSFSAEMRAALRTRTALAARDLGQLEAAVVALLLTENARMSGAMFSELNRDSVFDDRLEIEIETGWSYACAAIERRSAQVRDLSPRSRNLWSNWSRLAGNPGPEPRPGADQLNGYITRVG